MLCSQGCAHPTGCSVPSPKVPLKQAWGKFDGDGLQTPPSRPILMPRVSPKRLLSISLPPHSALGGMEMQKVHGGKLSKVWDGAVGKMTSAGLKLAVTPTERRLHLPSRAALFPLRGFGLPRSTMKQKLRELFGVAKLVVLP